jgi:hypothetical protein
MPDFSEHRASAIDIGEVARGSQLRIFELRTQRDEMNSRIKRSHPPPSVVLEASWARGQNS